MVNVVIAFADGRSRMGYTMPFTPLQRREAVRAYRSYHRHQLLLKRQYPPLNAVQKRILADYADALRAIRAALAVPDARVNVTALTRADAWAKWSSMEYWRARVEEK
jgi:hypothetical protein